MSMETGWLQLGCVGADGTNLDNWRHTSIFLSSLRKDLERCVYRDCRYGDAE